MKISKQDKEKAIQEQKEQIEEQQKSMYRFGFCLTSRNELLTLADMRAKYRALQSELYNYW